MGFDCPCDWHRILSCCNLAICGLPRRLRMSHGRHRSNGQPLRMHHGNGEHENCKDLMRESKRKRRLIEQRGDTEESLQCHRSGQNHSAPDGAGGLPCIEGVRDRKDPDRVGDYAVIELNHQRIFEQIAPGRRGRHPAA